MSDRATRISIADQVTEILKQSAREPGINEMLSLMRLSSESVHVQHIQAEMSPQGFVTQTSDLHLPTAR